MPGTARLEAYFQALTSGNRQVFRDLCASVQFRTSEVADGASAIAHTLDTSAAYVTAGAKLLSLKNATVEKFSVGYDGQTLAYTFAASLYLWSNGGVYGQTFIVPDRTIAASAPLFQGTQTWNNGAVTFKALTVDITDTASASGSLLMDLMVGGVSQFSIRKDGVLRGYDYGTFAYPVVVYGIGGPTSGFGSDGAIFQVRSSSTAALNFGSFTGSPYGMWVQTTGLTYPLVLQPAGGNVGIGSTDPGARLEVASSGAVVIFRDTTYSQRYSVSTGQNGGANWGGLQALDGAQLRFGVDNGLPGNNPAIVIQSATYGTANCVGIGTTSPVSLLHVNAADGSNASLSLYAEGANNAIIDYYRAGAFRCSVGVGGGDNNYHVYIAGTSVYAFNAEQTGAISLNSGTLTASAPIAMTQTWNSGATTFTAFKVNVTDTASASASLLMDLQVASSSMFAVTKAGTVTMSGNLTTTTGYVAASDVYANRVLFGVATADVMLKRVATSVLGVYQGDGTTGGTIRAAQFLLGANLGCWDVNTGNLQLHRDSNAIGWSDGDASPGNTGWSLALYKDAAGILAQRNGTNAQELRIYGTTTGPKYLSLSHNGTYSYIGTNDSASFVFGSGAISSYSWAISGPALFPNNSGGICTLGTSSERIAAFYGGGNTVTASAPVLNLTQTWNSGAVDFVGILADFTATASGAGSLLMDLRLGGTSLFKVGKTVITAGIGIEPQEE